MLTIPLQIRPSDQDSLGHVNNAAYVAYLQQAIAEYLARAGFAADWRANGQAYWTMQELAIEYRQASFFDDEIAADVWLAEADAIRPLFGCHIVRTVDGDRQIAVRARSRWQRMDASNDGVLKLPASFLDRASGPGGDLPRPFREPSGAGHVRCYHWRHTVERAEVGLDGRLHPHAFFEWIEESILCASAEAGWPIERLLAEDFVVFQMRHDATFHSRPALGEEVEIASRLVQARRLGGSWLNQVRGLPDSRLLVTNYSTGVFVNLAGRPSSPPPGMIVAMQGLQDEDK